MTVVSWRSVPVSSASDSNSTSAERPAARRVDPSLPENDAIPTESTLDASELQGRSRDNENAETRHGRGLWIGIAMVAVLVIAALLALVLSGDDESSAAKQSDQDAGKTAPPPQQTKTKVTKRTTADPRKPTLVPPHRGHVIQLIGTFAPAEFDVTKELARARKIARAQHEDAELIEIEADNVGPDGTANLTLGKNAIVDYKFRSPSRSKTPTDADLIRKTLPFCRYRVYADKSRFYHYPVDEPGCKAPLLGPPKCSAAQVWAMAKTRGLAEDLRLAKLLYTAVGNNKNRRGAWIFSAGTKVALKLPDNCKN